MAAPRHLVRRALTGVAALALATNHFLHPDFATADEINVFARNSSVRRLRAATDGLAALGADAGPEDHFALLSQPPIRVPDRPCCAAATTPSRGSGRRPW